MKNIKNLWLLLVCCGSMFSVQGSEEAPAGAGSGVRSCSRNVYSWACEIRDVAFGINSFLRDSDQIKNHIETIPSDLLYEIFSTKHKAVGGLNEGPLLFVLISHCAYNNSYNMPCIDSIRFGYLKAVLGYAKKLKCLQKLLLIPDTDGLTAFSAAIRACRVEIVKEIIEPLFSDGLSDVVEYFLTAPVMFQGKRCAPLSCVLSNGVQSIAAYLLECGDRVGVLRDILLTPFDLPGESCLTPLEELLLSGDQKPQMVKLLLDKGKDAGVIDKMLAFKGVQSFLERDFGGVIPDEAWRDITKSETNELIRQADNQKIQQMLREIRWRVHADA